MFFRLIKQERRSKAALAAVFAMALMAAGCSSAAPAAEETAVEQQVAVIKTEAVAKHSMGAPREQVAEVSASVHLDIPTMASGKIARVLKSNGDTVKKGEAIIQLESNLAVLDRKRAETSLSAAEQSLVKAKQEIASGRSTLLNNIASLETQYIQASAGDDQNLIDAARRNLESAKQQLADLDNGSSLSGLQSQIDAARLAVEQADLQLDSYQITAPASGTITDFAVSEGMTINAGTVVAVVQNVKQISIKTELSEPAAELARGKSDLVYYNSENPSVKKKRKWSISPRCLMQKRECTRLSSQRTMRMARSSQAVAFKWS